VKPVSGVFMPEPVSYIIPGNVRFAGQKFSGQNARRRRSAAGTGDAVRTAFYFFERLKN